jgi:hypothetical protein
MSWERKCRDRWRRRSQAASEVVGADDLDAVFRDEVCRNRKHGHRGVREEQPIADSRGWESAPSLEGASARYGN